MGWKLRLSPGAHSAAKAEVWAVAMGVKAQRASSLEGGLWTRGAVATGVGAKGPLTDWRLITANDRDLEGSKRTCGEWKWNVSRWVGFCLGSVVDGRPLPHELRKSFEGT